MDLGTGSPKANATRSKARDPGMLQYGSNLKDQKKSRKARASLRRACGHFGVKHRAQNPYRQPHLSIPEICISRRTMSRSARDTFPKIPPLLYDLFLVHQPDHQNLVFRLLPLRTGPGTQIGCSDSLQVFGLPSEVLTPKILVFGLWTWEPGSPKANATRSKARDPGMLQYGSKLKEQKKVREARASPRRVWSHFGVKTVHKIRTVSHTSRYQKSAYLEEPCLDLQEIPSRKSLRSCTICFWYTNRTTKNLVFRLLSSRTGPGTKVGCSECFSQRTGLLSKFSVFRTKSGVRSAPEAFWTAL